MQRTPTQQRSFTDYAQQLLKEQGILIAFLILLIGMSFASDRFLTSDNVLSVVRQVSIVGTIALGVTFVVIGGNLDLSVGSMLSLTTVLVVDLHDKIGPAPAILITFLVALFVGAINGGLVGFLRLNSLIVTLGMLSVLQGATLIYTGGKNVDIANQEDTWFAFFGRGDIFGISVPIVIFLGLAAILAVVLQRSGYGRKIFALGGNVRASAYSGLQIRWLTLSTYLISAFTVACAAVILGSRVMGSQNNVGQGWELQVLAGIILGGTSLLGGSGSILKTVIGILILGFIQNGLLLLGYPFFVQWLVTWFVIIVAVWLDVASRRGKLFV